MSIPLRLFFVFKAYSLKEEAKNVNKNMTTRDPRTQCYILYELDKVQGMLLAKAKEK